MIRSARPDDHAAYVRLHDELGVPEAAQERATWIAEAMPRTAMFCDERDAAVGYVSWRQYGTLAHVMHLAVDPALRGRRIGEQLLVHARDAAKSAGCTRWYLNVKRDNASALRLYDRVGLRLELESFALKVPWSVVPRVDVRERLLDDSGDEDATVARLFGVPADRVASFRARPGYRLVTLRDDADIMLGFAAFSPSFPGAATFCARETNLAVPMLEAVRRHADPQFDYVRVTIEGDTALANAVLALGAELTFEILRLSADIP
jgi:GNAT superfamily N-acetyltransferase